MVFCRNKSTHSAQLALTVIFHPIGQNRTYLNRKKKNRKKSFSHSFETRQYHLDTPGTKRMALMFTKKGSEKGTRTIIVLVSIFPMKCNYMHGALVVCSNFQNALLDGLFSVTIKENDNSISNLYIVHGLVVQWQKTPAMSFL